MSPRPSHLVQVVCRCLLNTCFIILVQSTLLRAQSPQACTGLATNCGNYASCIANKCACMSDYFSPTGTNTDCQSVNVADSRCSAFNSQCVYCGTTFEGPCQKGRAISKRYTNHHSLCADHHLIHDLACATDFLDTDSKCVKSCSNGYSITEVKNTVLYAKTCLENTSNTEPLPVWAIILIAVLSIAFLIMILTVPVIVAFLRFRSTAVQSFPVQPSSLHSLALSNRGGEVFIPSHDRPPSMADMELMENIEVHKSEDEDEEQIFLIKLSYLKYQSEAFLSILNDVRRRTAKLPLNSEDAVKYKKVSQDLMRLLYLLNKKPVNLKMPPDGVQLLTWAEKVLETYPFRIQKSRSINHKPKQTSRLSRIGEQDETDF